MSSLNNLGLSKKEIIQHIKDDLNKNADILMGIDDPEMNLLINVLVDAVGKVIEENNRKIGKDITDWLNGAFR